MRHAATSSGWATCLFLILSLCAALLLGYVVGVLHEAGNERARTPMRITTGSGGTVPTVSISAWRLGSLEGKLEGEARVLVEGKAVVPAADGSFRVTVPVKTTSVKVDAAVPEGMRFVASKKGKKYYPVDSSAGKALSPANRVYFPDSASAEAAGFVQ